MIIGLNGRLKSGKDTTYGIIKQLVTDQEVIQVSFARKLKESAAAAIGVDLQTLEDMKGREDLYYRMEFTSAPGSRFMTDEFRFNVREYLQWYGTEAHRDIFGDDFWVDMAMPLDKDYSDALYVVTDMRFPNEVARVKELGGTTVKVVREVATGHSAHASEQNIDDQIDIFLDNTGTLLDLRDNVKNLLAKMDVQKGFQTGLFTTGIFPPLGSAAEAESMRGWRA